MSQALLLYIPIIHEGYIRLFEKYRGKTETIYVLGQGFIDEFSLLHKELRALSPQLIKKSLEALGYFSNVIILEGEQASDLLGLQIITTEDEMCRKFLSKYLPQLSVIYESVFLRWDEKNIKSDHVPRYSRESSYSVDHGFMSEARNIAKNAGDWWRQVGGVIVKDGVIVLSAHNMHLPHDAVHYSEGDPRDFVKAGTAPESKTSIHAEQLLISEAAKQGVKLLGTSLYVTTFPCAPCAQLVACSGIKKCFFESGNAYMDSERVMEAAGVEIIKLK